MSKGLKNKGLHTHRFKGNPEERRFAEAWEEQNRHCLTLPYLLDPEHGCGIRRPPDPSDRDREVAATVVQWLGSPVGRSFLRDLGYERRS